MKQLSDGALITIIQRLLGEGHSPKQIASSLDVSIVRLVKLVALGAEHTNMTTDGERGWPVGVAVASEEVAMSVGTDPRWDLSVNVQRVAPSVRATAPYLHGPYLDVRLDVQREEPGIRPRPRPARPSETPKTDGAPTRRAVRRLPAFSMPEAFCARSSRRTFVHRSEQALLTSPQYGIL